MKLDKNPFSAFFGFVFFKVLSSDIPTAIHYRDTIRI